MSVNISHQGQQLHAFELLAQSINIIEIQPYRLSIERQNKDIDQIKQQINKYLKEHYNKSCYSKVLRNQLRQKIYDGEIHEMNYNWVLLELSGARAMRAQNKGVYQKLLSNRDRYPDTFFQPIQTDVPRTASPSRQSEQHESRIDNVLSAYAIRNPFVQYCQGLNFITHFIVNKLKFSEEDAFWVLCCLIEHIMPLDYYTNMISVIIDTRILDYYSRIFTPALNAHFKDIYVETNFYAIQWLVCLFTPNLHIEMIKEIWLRVTVDGNQALLIASLAILHIFEQQLLTYFDFAELLEYFKKKLKQYDNVAEFRYICNQIKINTLLLNEARDILRDEHNTNNLSKGASHSVDNTPCNPQWNVCQQVLRLNRTIKRSFSFFSYSQQQPFNVISDYWNKSMQSNNNPEAPILIGRQFHICYDKHKKQQQEQDSTYEEIRPRATTCANKHLNEQSYDGFYEQIKQMPTFDEDEDILQRELKSETIKQKYRMARMSVSSIAFASKFVQN